VGLALRRLFRLRPVVIMRMELEGHELRQKPGGGESTAADFARMMLSLTYGFGLAFSASLLSRVD
jgi:hypothetical protein